MMFTILTGNIIILIAKSLNINVEYWLLILDTDKLIWRILETQVLNINGLSHALSWEHLKILLIFFVVIPTQRRFSSSWTILFSIFNLRRRQLIFTLRHSPLITVLSCIIVDLGQAHPWTSYFGWIHVVVMVYFWCIHAGSIIVFSYAYLGSSHNIPLWNS